MIYDFTILGSGISAKICSIALAKKNFEVCLVIDKINKSPSNLVTFLSNGSLNYLHSIFNDISIFRHFQNITDVKCLLEGIESNKDQSISFRDESGNSMGKIVNNTFLDEYLDKEIKSLKNINKIFTDEKIQFKENEFHSELMFNNGDKIDTKIFILSSTKHKKLLDNSSIDLIEQDFHQCALSISADVDLKYNNFASQVFTTDGSIALLPYYVNEASVVWSLNKNSKYLKMSQEDLNLELKDFIIDCKINNIERHILHFNYAKKLFNKKMVLIGNVAHNIHPIAGQGLNLSIKDITLFAELMFQYSSIGYDIINELILEKFDQQRRLDNFLFSFGIFGLEEILKQKNRYINFLTGKVISKLQSRDYLKNVLVASATGRKIF